MGDNLASNKKEVTIVLLPVQGMGHLIAMVELAKHLLLHCSATNDGAPKVTMTILNMQPTVPNPQISSYVASMSSSHPGITFHDLPKVEPPPITNPLAFMSTVMDLHRPLVKNALEAIHVPVASLILDLFCSNMVDVAKELGIPSYIFFTSSAAGLGLMLHLPSILPQLPHPDQYEGKDVAFPGFAHPVPLMSMPEPLMASDDVAVQALSRFASRYEDVAGILINTFAELQPTFMKALEERLYHQKVQSVYAVGPILSVEPRGNNKAAAGVDGRHECIRWLDDQPPNSVVFLCFGSMGSFPTDQAREIAAGLEASDQRFLWVLRSPPAQVQPTPGKEQEAVQRTVIPTPSDAVLEEVLPEGFLERTSNRGMVWPSFAPQAEILAHAAVGGFVTHCGWNSSLESIWYGVPMAAWPLYAEQHFNAFEMVKEMGVAVEVRTDRKKGNTAPAKEVERVVSLLMGQEDGGKVREKTKQMKFLARSALSKDGSSFLALEKFMQELNICGAA